MKKMKKVLALLLVFVLTISLGACKSSPKEEPGTDAATEEGADSEGGETKEADGEYEFSEPVTIKFANYAILEAGYDKFWDDVKKGFEEKYPNIKVEYMTAEYGQMLTQVVTWAGGGEIPWIPTLADAGLAIPVTDVFSEDYLSQIYPSMLEATNIDGVPYGIPMYASPFIMFYNRDLFEQAGLDPDTPPTTCSFKNIRWKSCLSFWYDNRFCIRIGFLSDFSSIWLWGLCT